MKKLIAGLALASAAAFGVAPKADASPVGVVSTRMLPGGHVSIGFGTGGYYGGSYGGYYRTEYRWVQRTVVVGYDAYGNPLFGAQWVQEPVTVWVPVYQPVYTQPSFRIGLGFGFGHGGHHWH